MPNKSPTEEIAALKERVAKLEREWLEEHRIIEVLVAAGFITQAKVEKARDIVSQFKS